MSNTKEGVNNINENNSVVIKDRQLDFTSKERDLGFYSTSTMGSSETRNTVKLAPFAPNLGMTENNRREASPSVMEGIYIKTDAGKQREEELGVLPLPFSEANELNDRDRRLNDAKLLEKMENRTPKKRKNNKLYIGICISFALIVIIIASVAAISASNDEVKIDGQNEDQNEDANEVKGLFNTTDIQEIRNICDNFVLSEFVEEDDSDFDTQFLVCTGEFTFHICHKVDDNFLLQQRDCRNGLRRVCPCNFGDFIDLRRSETLDEDDICIESQSDSEVEVDNENCNFLLDQDSNFDLKTFL